MFEQSPAADKQLHYVKADHFGFPCRRIPTAGTEGSGLDRGRVAATAFR